MNFKLLWDCASTAHIVTGANLLDDYVSCNLIKVQWGTYGHVMLAYSHGTLTTRNRLPNGKTAGTSFKHVLHVPDFGVNILSVKYVAPTKQGCGVYFRAGAQFYDQKGNLVSWSKEPRAHSDLYPLECDVVSRKRSEVVLATQIFLSTGSRWRFSRWSLAS